MFKNEKCSCAQRKKIHFSGEVIDVWKSLGKMMNKIFKIKKCYTAETVSGFKSLLGRIEEVT